MATIVELNSHRMLAVADGDPVLATVSDFAGLLGDAMGEDVRMVAIPAGRLADDFFRLRTGLAGEVLQKFVNYGFKLAIIGDVSRWVEESNAFRDLLIELERGTDVYAVPDFEALEARLASAPAR